MNEDDKSRLFDICRRSKLGQYISIEDRQWSQEQSKNSPDEYSEIHKAAVRRAISEYLGPFGRGSW